jgi:rubrerythrin
MRIILTALVAGVVLVAYVMIERRISQRPCPECGFRVSIDGLDEDCPQCGSLIPKYRESKR